MLTEKDVTLPPLIVGLNSMEIELRIPLILLCRQRKVEFVHKVYSDSSRVKRNRNQISVVPVAFFGIIIQGQLLNAFHGGQIILRMIGAKRVDLFSSNNITGVISFVVFQG